MYMAGKDKGSEPGTGTGYLLFPYPHLAAAPGMCSELVQPQSKPPGTGKDSNGAVSILPPLLWYGMVWYWYGPRNCPLHLGSLQQIKPSKRSTWRLLQAVTAMQKGETEQLRCILRKGRKNNMAVIQSPSPTEESSSFTGCEQNWGRELS